MTENDRRIMKKKYLETTTWDDGKIEKKGREKSENMILDRTEI